MSNPQKITPFLWFDNNAEEAVNYYLSVFKNGTIKNTARYSEDAAETTGQREGTVMTIEFQLEGQDFMALNGGPDFKFTEAVSFVVNCETQEEVDHYWNKLTAEGGSEVQCGWLKDKFGLSWQVVPSILGKLLSDKDRSKANRVMTAMLKMKKMVIADLKAAYAG